MCKRLCLVLGMLVAGAGAAATTWTFTPTEKNADKFWHFNNAQNWRDEAGATGLPQEGDRIELLERPNANYAADYTPYLLCVSFGPTNTQNVAWSGFCLKESAEAGDGFVYAPATAGAMWCSLFLDGTVTLDVQQASARLSFQAGVLGRGATRPGRFVKIGPGMVRAEDNGQDSKHLPHLRGGVIREGAFALGMRLPMKVAGEGVLLRRYGGRGVAEGPARLGKIHPHDPYARVRRRAHPHGHEPAASGGAWPHG